MGLLESKPVSFTAMLQEMGLLQIKPTRPDDCAECTEDEKEQEANDKDVKPEIPSEGVFHVKRKNGRKIITVAYSMIDEYVRYGATVFSRDSPSDAWNRKAHVRTALARLKNCSVELFIPPDTMMTREEFEQWLYESTIADGCCSHSFYSLDEPCPYPKPTEPETKEEDKMSKNIGKPDDDKDLKQPKPCPYPKHTKPEKEETSKNTEHKQANLDDKNTTQQQEPHIADPGGWNGFMYLGKRKKVPDYVMTVRYFVVKEFKGGFTGDLLLRYGATVFRRECGHDHWNKAKHKETAAYRFWNCPHIVKIDTPITSHKELRRFVYDTITIHGCCCHNAKTPLSEPKPCTFPPESDLKKPLVCLCVTPKHITTIP